MRYKRCFLIWALSSLFMSGMAESPNAVTWTVTSKKLANNRFVFFVQAKIADGWYIYAEPDSSDGIFAPEITLEDGQIISEIDTLVETRISVIRDKIFGKTLKVFEHFVGWTFTIGINGPAPPGFRINIHGFAANGKEFQPIEESRPVMLEGSMEGKTKLYGEIRLSSVNPDHPVANCGGKSASASSGLLNLFFLGMAGGLIALLTPCVFPMIPVTVSFFTGRAKTRREGIQHAALYSSSIFLTYLLASLPFHLITGISPEILNSISTNAWVNLAFFVIFIFFAFSFFGLYDISLPSALLNRANSKSSSRNLAGIFFMALTLATVSFSCTGPILGTLLVGSLSASGGAGQLTAGMAGFGLALALPFGLFALFPDWLKILPKSGGWMDTVKKVLAFVELALAFKFLSNADLVQHWGILKREIFIGIWMLIAVGLALYLFGVFGKKKQISIFRKSLAAFAVLFALYLAAGLTRSRYTDLKLLSGFPPPLSYSVYGRRTSDQNRLQPDVINDYEKALQLSRQQHKPLLIDFTGWACVNCRKMEEQVWTKPEIRSLIKDKFILVSLYVDDRGSLPPGERFIYKTKAGNEKAIRTLGDKWATFQSENFNQVTQPLYVILGPGEQLMNHPVGYTPDVAAYRQWLECGMTAGQDISKN